MAYCWTRLRRVRVTQMNEVRLRLRLDAFTAAALVSLKRTWPPPSLPLIFHTWRLLDYRGN
jgi:hypothetical protein